MNLKPNSEVDILKGEVLFDQDNHKYIWLGWEEKEDVQLVNVNQYVIIDNDEAIILDPGGIHVFPRIVGNISRYVDLEKIKYLFFSHQDPDVCSGIAMWLSITPAKVYISKWWVRFIPHFGIFDAKRIVGIDDKGLKLKFKSGRTLEIIPTHFLHSTANFTVYDPTSKIYFSGDLGTALFPPGKKQLFVEDFDEYASMMIDFHKRFLTSNSAIKYFLDKISKYDIEMIATQHGGIFPDKESSKKFFNWLKNIKCGVDNLKNIYG